MGKRVKIGPKRSFLIFYLIFGTEGADKWSERGEE